MCWSFRLETGSESIKVVGGTLYGLQPPRRAGRGLRSGHSGGDRRGHPTRPALAEGEGNLERRAERGK